MKKSAKEKSYYPVVQLKDVKLHMKTQFIYTNKGREQAFKMLVDKMPNMRIVSAELSPVFKG